jgi:hypothetical protein
MSTPDGVERFGVYFIFKVMEQGPAFRSCPPKYPTDDPHYRILKRHWSPYTHYYFYIRDEVLGPMILCVGSFLPFPRSTEPRDHPPAPGLLDAGVRTQIFSLVLRFSTEIGGRCSPIRLGSALPNPHMQGYQPYGSV